MCLKRIRRSYESKKVIKYSALGLVAVLATSALVACSSGKSASGKKTIEVGTVGTTKPFSYEEKRR